MFANTNIFLYFWNLIILEDLFLILYWIFTNLKFKYLLMCLLDFKDSY